MPKPSKHRGDNLYAAAHLLPLQALTASKTVETPETGWAQSGLFVLDFQAATADAGDTLDVYVDVSPDGVTWINAIHFPQIVGNASAQKHAVYLTTNVSATATTNVTADLAAGNARPLGLTDHMQVRAVTAGLGAGQSFTAQVLAFLKG